MLTVIVLTVAFLATQPPPMKKVATPPAATTPSTPVRAIDQLDTPQRKRLIERAKDFYLLPDGTYADAYRIHRIRELLAKGDWKKIPQSETDKLGVGHANNCDKDHIGQFGWSAPLSRNNFKNNPRPTYKNLPALVQVAAHDGALVVCQAPRVGGENGLAPDVEVHTHAVTTIPHKLTITQVIDGASAIAKMSYTRSGAPPAGIPKEGFHFIGSTRGLRDNSLYPGDFILIPRGSESYSNFAGVRSTVASYKLIPLDTPVTPEDLADAVRDGKVVINTYTVTSKAGSAPGVSLYEWKAMPIQFTFK